MKNTIKNTQTPDSNVVVADGGASGSRFAIFDHNGKRTGEAHGPPASLSLGAEAACDAIRSGLGSLGEQQYDDADWAPAHIMLGLAGAEEQQQRQAFKQLLSPTVDCDIVTDGYAHLMGVADGEPAICLSLGTGSVVHWHNGREHSMAGGWGFPVGDEASGAWLGRALVNAWLWSIDSSYKNHQGSATGVQTPLPGSSLIEALKKRIGKSRSDIQYWTINAVSTDYASLVDLMLADENCNDAFINDLRERGTAECRRLLALCPEDLSVYITGGLAPFYKDNLQNELGERLASAKGDALDGLRLLAINRLS